jgi:hypothetical protein
MQSVPDDGAYKAEDVSDHGGKHDEHNRRRRVEWLDELHRLDHVRPENEIEDRLRPADENKNRPNHMPTGINAAITSPTLFGLGRCSLFGVRRIYLRACRKTRRARN